MSAPPTQKSPPKWVYWLSGQPLFNGLAKAYRWLRSILENIPAFSALDRIAKAVTGKVYRIVRLPSNLEARVDPLLEIEAGRQMDPILAAALFAFFAGLGLYPSSLGHMDTTPYLFSVLPFVGVFNPYLGLCSGVVFAVFDWAGKWLYPLLSSLGSWVPVESVYGGNWSDGAQNFFGARAGYLFGYSIVLLTPLLPGILARVFRIVIHRLARQVLQRPTAAAAAGLLLLGGSAFAVTRLAGSEGALLLAVFPIILLAGSTASMSYGAGFVESVARALGTAGSVVGGMLGGGLSNSYARGPGNYMAFEAVRADPDLSCRALSAGNYMAHRPVTMATAAGGGFFPAGSAGALNPLVTQMTAMGGPMVFPGAIGGTNAPPAKPAGTAPDDPLEGEAKTSLRPEPLTPTPAPGTPDPAEGKPEQQSEWGHCMNCGMSLDNPKEPCPFCGGAWVKATDPRTTDPRNPLKGKICPVCGLSLPHFSTSCPACARTAK
ncbi:MAG: hypothetical protein HKO65_14985, partial [Gemmatimonadetes bacterium]|nr:hypothetical protein [Gemmatimonadota bacterium]